MKHLSAREAATIYCNFCLKRWALVFEPDFARGEEDQVQPQLPIYCPFCGEQDLEQEGKAIKDARILSDELIRQWRTG